MSNLKESHLLQTAEIAVALRIGHEPAFNWLVKHVLKTRDRIIARVRKQQTRYFKKSHTLGIELPLTVEQPLALDAKNCNTLWADAISKELENLNGAFMILQDGKKATIGHQFVQCHMVFDIKVKNSEVRPGLFQETT